jgi:acetyl-CoA synthetase
MREYQDAYDNFSITEVERRVLHGSLTGGLNACIECCDRWATDGRVALEWFGARGERERVTFASLQDGSARFANLLSQRGIGPGDVVAGLMPRIPELLTLILGTWRVGAVYQPLFTAFGPKAIEDRVTGPQGSKAKLIVTDPTNRSKLGGVADCPSVLLVDRHDSGPTGFAATLAAHSAQFAPVIRHSTDLFVLIFTSGTSGRAKGVPWSLAQLLQLAAIMEDVVDLQIQDTYWCFADPGWGLGMGCTLTAPLLTGHSTVLYEGSFTVESTVRVIAEAGVTNLVAAPTVFRMMRASGDDAMAPIVGRLRCITSGGEPLSAEISRWGTNVLGRQINEAYGQTELGVNICNHHGLRHARVEGSVGLPSPGYTFAVLDDDLQPVPPGQPGVLALDRSRSPLFLFRGYWRAETPAFQDRWYLTGDVMRQDPSGHFVFICRNDDIIKSAGYRIGPAEIEGAIIEHPAVAEVAVIGKPDAERGEIVKAFVVVRPGHEADVRLAVEIQRHVRDRLAQHAYPREIEFLDELPKNPSGKVQRFVLRERERQAASADIMAETPPL